MSKIGLGEVMDALHVELAAAVEKAKGQNIVFPIDSVQLELQIGVTWSETANGGVKFWVLELGASANHTHASIQKVTINLQAPRYVEEVKGPGEFDFTTTVRKTVVLETHNIDPMKPNGPTNLEK